VQKNSKVSPAFLATAKKWFFATIMGTDNGGARITALVSGLRGKEPQVPPLRSFGAPVLINKPRRWKVLNFPGGLQIPPLRFAPVGMTREEW
jgi:hypothetical protein